MKISFSRAREKNLSHFSSRISRDRDSCQCLAQNWNCQICIPSVTQAVPDSLFTSSPFLPAPAEELLQSGQFNSEVEVILGTCKDEGLSDLAGAWLDPEFFETIRDTFDTAGTARILGLMRYSDVTPADVEKAHKIIDAYVGGVENITSSNIQNLIDMMTDSSMLYGAHKKIGYLLDQGVPV